jgi:hypothetical protein
MDISDSEFMSYDQNNVFYKVSLINGLIVPSESSRDSHTVPFIIAE